MANRYYLGAGPWEPDFELVEKFTNLARTLKRKQYKLRSTAFNKSDKAFLYGADGNSFSYDRDLAHPASFRVAETYHRNWNVCSDFTKGLMAARTMSVLGMGLDKPVDFIVCYIPDGTIEAGIIQVLEIANHYGIEIYNLFDLEDEQNLMERIR